MSTDEIVDLLKTMPKEEARIFLSYLQNQKAKKIEKLIKYEDDTAGGLMTAEYIRVRPEWTVEEAVAEVKKLSPTLRSVLYVYVLDEEDKFFGAVSLRWLVVSEASKKIRELLKTFPASSVLQVDQDIEDVIKVMTKYDLYTAVVLDKEQRMLGTVTIDDVMRHLVPQA
jgi:magnesium transporter